METGKTGPPENGIVCVLNPDAPNSNTSNPNSKGTYKLHEVEKVYREHFNASLWLPGRTALAVVGSLSLAKRAHCLVLVFEGDASAGKSIIVGSLGPERGDPMEEFLYRSDKFTPASFVSHAADRSAEELDKIDLLPRLQNRTLITKELSPLFQGDEHSLRENFSLLTSILDGEGHSSDSGSHGQRQVTGDYVFNWLGATTRIPARTHNLMSHMGSRLLLYEMPESRATREEYARHAQEYEQGDAKAAVKNAMMSFVWSHFQRYPKGSIKSRDVELPDAEAAICADVGIVLAAGRATEHSKEQPWRVITLLAQLAKGNALIDERMLVLPGDMEMVKHVGLSTLTPTRRRLMQVLSATGQIIKCSTPTPHTGTQEELDNMVQTDVVKWSGVGCVKLAKDYDFIRGLF